MTGFESTISSDRHSPQEKSLPDSKLTQEQALAGAKEFSEKYVARGAYEFFPEQEIVEVVQHGLAENQVKQGYRYCP